jgi:hypothetical protein
MSYIAIDLTSSAHVLKWNCVASRSNGRMAKLSLIQLTIGYDIIGPTNMARKRQRFSKFSIKVKFQTPLA